MNWETVKEYKDILYDKCEGVAKITINRTHRRNAFTPDTVQEMIDAFSNARDDNRIGVVLLCGANPQSDGQYAFCA
ncbi:MAG: 1,4-dihydroxy-2-naphthoyl-CoA synthase, partial [Puniceicoccaceae bacterium]|nr:1,4-dihydroxy-2-naphthoyl-CoA synthase [Puniceicoccaceae bacterium]